MRNVSMVGCKCKTHEQIDKTVENGELEHVYSKRKYEPKQVMFLFVLHLNIHMMLL